MKVYTRKGDDGTTGLLYGGRVDKCDLRTEAYGSVDEAVAVLGIARSLLPESELGSLILELQRELFVLGAELATAHENSHRLVAGRTRVSPNMIDALEVHIDSFVERGNMPREFVVPGESTASAHLDLARTVIRRAERAVVAMDRAGVLADRTPLRYLNRLADLMFVLARYEEAGFRPARHDSGERPSS